jgi:hypothetical protein
MIEKAKEYAINKHLHPAEECRYGDAPYFFHLEAVAIIGQKYIEYIKEEDRVDVMSAIYKAEKSVFFIVSI